MSVALDATRAPSVVVRPLETEDLPSLLCWEADLEVRRWMGNRFGSIADVTGWFLDVKRSLNRTAFAIEVDGAVIGEIELDNIDWRGKSAEIRICIGDPVFRGRGFGTRALLTLMDIMKRSGKLKRLYLRVDAENRRAISCYLRCGFKKIGLLRRSRFVPSDLLLMAVDV